MPGPYGDRLLSPSPDFHWAGGGAMAGRSSAPGRSVTSRALAILDAFDSTAPRLTLTEIAERSGIPLTTAHRLLGELTDWGALTRRSDGRFEIGRKLWDLGLLAPVQLELRQVAAPFLQDLHTTIRDTVHLAVREGLQALYVERISGRESVPIVSQVGSRLPLHATGVGKVLLAAAPPDVVEQALRSLTRQTRHTLVDPGRIRRELAEVRRRQYARTSEEMSPGAASLAVPVQVEVRRGPVVVAALGIVVPRTGGTFPASCPCCRSPPVASDASSPVRAISTDRKVRVPRRRSPRSHSAPCAPR
ncbi:IclR family transcriptional regulator [Blastococcus brunescens]|uniref:IclR family transcriptional regulator n=1 Tax=Blastococcus brunescens TaxID=1564165 RepID=A0ABZ1B7K0_9ACTN|nr:IclR family transcriptional regulator [Blastococcus sp. BMG 8361]WRL66780.1 IclR family transcriptional regulator [Blastococcus sp. BMG 8361]